MKKISNILFIIAMTLAVIFGLGMLSVQARPGLSEDRAQKLALRLEVLKTNHDTAQGIKTSLRSIMEEIEALQIQWSNEAESHRRELAGVQSDYEGNE